MNNTIIKTPTCTMKSFDNLFIELTAKNCNQRCKNCYIDFPLNKNVKDFISFDQIKNALIATKKENIKCIYLMGAEPMTHPEFNSILRLCLKYSNVCIYTNGTFINEKKARFLKKVQDEGNNEIIFKLSIDHFNEMKNDDVRSRGSYRTTINAIKYLAKYQFNPILCVTNFYNEPKDLIIREFTNICKKQGYDINNSNFQINICFDKNQKNEINEENILDNLDCAYGRILTSNGVYSCPFLANDYRGRCGSNFEDFAKHNPIESEYCNTCIENQNILFGINYKLFEQAT